MCVDIEEVKNRLEKSSKFKHYQQEKNISFTDFKVIDINTNTIIQKGSGDYSIMIDGEILSAYYPI